MTIVPALRRQPPIGQPLAAVSATKMLFSVVDMVSCDGSLKGGSAGLLTFNLVLAVQPNELPHRILPALEIELSTKIQLHCFFCKTLSGY